MAEELGRIDVTKTAQRQPPSAFAQFLAEGMMLGARPSTHIVNPMAVQQVKQDAAKSQFLAGMMDRLKLGVLGAAQGAGAGNFLSEEMNRRSQAQENQLAAAKAQEDLRRWQAEFDLKKAGENEMVPFITTGKDGQPIMQGMVPKGSIVRQDPQTIIDLARAKSEIPTADMRNQLKSAQQAGSLINDLEAQAKKLKGGYEGLYKQGEAFITRGAGESGDYKMYEDLAKSGAVAFYRAVTGDSRLSDQDAADRAYPLMWKTNEDVSLREKKFNFLRRMVKAREELLSSGKYSAEDVIPMSVLKDKAKSVKSEVEAEGWNDAKEKRYQELLMKKRGK